MGTDILEIGGWTITAAIGILGIIKFRLIEELVKKISSDDSKAKFYSMLLLLSTIVILSIVTSNLSPTQNAPEPVSEQNSEEILTENIPVDAAPAEEAQEVERTDLEVKVDVAKDVLNTGKDLVEEIKANKRKKDSIFQASLEERWVYQVGDWTDDDDKILEVHDKLRLATTENIKVFKQKRKYIFIIERYLSKEKLEKSLDSLKVQLTGLSVNILNLNTYILKRNEKLIQREESFGKRKNKIKLECLVID